MKKELIDGFVSHDQLVFGGPHRGGFVSKGYAVNSPSLENASPSLLNQMELELRAILRNVRAGSRLQFHWSTGGEYRDELLHYYEETDERASEAWPKRQRNERFSRYWERMELGGLRRERLRVYLTHPIETEGGSGGFDQLLQSTAQGFRLFERELGRGLLRLGGGVTALDEAQLFDEYQRVLSPSAAREGCSDFDPSRSILENCLNGEATAVETPEAGFYLDGFYHGLLSLNSLPQSTCVGLIHQLTGLPIGDIAITVNVTPLDVSEEIGREEAAAEKLRHTLRHSSGHRMTSALELKLNRIRRLMSNEVVPFRAQFIIRAWDQSKEGLQQKLGILKSAILKLQSAKYYEPAFPTSARNYFRASLPGWSWDKYDDCSHYIEDHNLAHLLPISGSSDASLGEAEALYDGSIGNLIGIRSFDGAEGSEAPQHAFVTGKTGSGKSLFLIDLLTQTEPFYDYTVIVDDGLSYGTYTEAVCEGARPIIIEPNSGAVLNYLDTRGEPLSPEHLADAVAVASRMAGVDQESDGRMEAVLSRCLSQFYEDCFQDWADERKDQLDRVIREATLLHAFRQERGLLLIEGWRRLRRWEAANPQEAARLRQDLSYDDISSYRLREESRDEVFRLAFAFVNPEEAPIHSDFQKFLELESLGDSRDRNEIGLLATALAPWCREQGRYGSLFDGVNNIDFSQPVVHLELGMIPDSAPELRAMAAFVVTNQVRNEIVRRPRSQRKRVVLEELGAFLSIPGGDRIAREFYERMRKYNCWVISVVQQLGALAECGAARSIIGNSRLGIFFKQSSAEEVSILAEAFQLPASSRETHLRFPEPSGETGAAFLCCLNTGESPLVVTGCNIVHPEMLYLAASGGEHFEKRKAELENCESVVEAVIKLAAESGSTDSETAVSEQSAVRR